MSPKANHYFAELTRRASRTFYIASLFFPTDVRDDVHILYSFLRVADDMVDAVPPQIDQYEMYKAQTQHALEGRVTGDTILDSMAQVVHRWNIDPGYIDAYFTSQDLDLHTRQYETQEDLDRFIYGVADVVGLMMARIMRLDISADKTAMLLGHAMQMTNILRDVQEDTVAGKVYLPQADLTLFGLSGTVEKSMVKGNEEKVTRLIRYEVEKTRAMLHDASKGIALIPTRCQLPIRLSVKVYEYVLGEIFKSPLQVFTTRVKPSIMTLVTCLLSSYRDHYMRR